MLACITAGEGSAWRKWAAVVDRLSSCSVGLACCGGSLPTWGRTELRAADGDVHAWLRVALTVTDIGEACVRQ